MRIFKYKKMYEDLEESFEKELEIFEKEKTRLGKEIYNINQSISNYKERIKADEIYIQIMSDKLDNYDLEFTKLKLKNSELEKKRRSAAGKVGFYVAKQKELEKEKEEMMTLINNLINERKRLLKEKKTPTLEELKKYFRSN